MAVSYAPRAQALHESVFQLVLAAAKVNTELANTALRSYLDDECYPALLSVVKDESKTFDATQTKLKPNDQLYLIFKCITSNDLTQD